MARHTVALTTVVGGGDPTRALRGLSDALGSHVPAPGADGIVEVRVEAGDFEAALERAWDAIAAAGADDHVAFAEHPDIPEHWRRRGVDGPPGAFA